MKMKNKKLNIIIAVCLTVALAAELAIVLFDKKEADDNIASANFYINGQAYDNQLLYGVEGKSNLFEPNKEITVVIDCQKTEFKGEQAEVKISTDQGGFLKKETVTLGENQKVTFTTDCNGIYKINFKTPDNKRHSFQIAVMPKNQRASDDFYYGIQPYLTRAYLWGEGFQLPNYDGEQSVDLILDAAEYMGVNLVREDSVGWGAIQQSPNGKADFTQQDYIVNKVNERQMKLNLIFGFNAGRWSAAAEFQDGYDESKGWTYAPDQALWHDYVNKTARQYKSNNDILWEIWNEPNWAPFFTGTKEQYFDLLESAAKALKGANPKAYVFSGGLAVAEKESNLPYYQKAAELIEAGYLDSFGYHNHDGFDTYYNNMSKMLLLNQAAGLTGGINSESGSYKAGAELLVCKALYTRATGARGFVSFAFRKTVTPENDINEFAYFNEYLQPTEAVVAYSTVIRFLGNAKYEKSISSEQNLQIDQYTKDGKRILVYYSMGGNSKAAIPEGDYTAYDMYGNELEASVSLAVSTQPIYVVYK